jgi:rRNA maturation endonuclease Nob1
MKIQSLKLIQMTLSSRNWKEWCDRCKKYHITTLKPCPSCGKYSTPQPLSEKVYEKHLFYEYDCDGCEAYRDHTR